MTRILLLILFYSELQRLLADTNRIKICNYSYGGNLFRYKSTNNYKETLDNLWIRTIKRNKDGLEIDDLPYDFDKEIKEALLKIRDKDILLPLIKSHDINIYVTYNTEQNESVNEISLDYNLFYSSDKNKLPHVLHSKLMSIYNDLKVSCHSLSLRS